MMFRTWVLMLILFLEVSQQFTDDDLGFVITVHGAFCGKTHICTAQENQEGRNFTTTLDKLPVPIPDNINPNCCKPCSCDKKTCMDFVDCCPDVLDALPSIEESKKSRRTTCQKMTVKGVGDTFRVYNRCTENYQRLDNDTVETKSKCEQSEDYVDFDTKQPVIDSESGRTYANLHCAKCDYVPESNLIKWTPRLFCRKGAVFTQSPNIGSIIKDILNTENCDIQFLWPKSVSYESPKCRRVEPECNKTGKWIKYDPVIEAACFSYRSIYSYWWYNVFCFLCNGKRYDTEYCNSKILEGNMAVSFAAVIRFSDEPVKKEEPVRLSQCSNNQVYDYFKNICRNLSCNFPRFLKDGECVNIGDDIIGLAYRLHLKVTPLENYDFMRLEDMASMINEYGQSELVTKWDNWNALASFTLFYKLTNEENSTSSDTISPSTTESSRTSLMTNRQMTSTDTSNQQETGLEQNSSLNSGRIDSFGMSPSLNTFDVSPMLSDSPPTIAASSIEYFLLQIEWNFLDPVSKPHSSDFIDTLLNLDGLSIALSDPKSEKSVNFHLSIHEFLRNDNLYPLDPMFNSSLVTYPLKLTLPKERVLNEYMPIIQSLTPALVCPMVKINDNEYDITINFGGIVVEELAKSFDRKNVKMSAAVNYSVLSICKNSFLNANKKSAPKAKENIGKVQGVLSIVCACISILFCLLTLLTYALFSELRTQPGINIMFLCTCLICAQTMFTFAVPQSENVSNSICTFLGGFVHFFWLMVIFAMNICSYHMFIAFIQNSSHGNKTGSTLVRSTLYIVYCVLASLVFVAINIIVSVFGYENGGIGYGDDGMCYISRKIMIGYTFALPAGVVIFVNLVFFIIVVVKISRLPSINSSNMKARNNLSIYARLSTLTGLTWIFGFLFEFTKHVIFEYLLIILNGGIGVLIFISFVCNKRTLNLYKGRFLASRKSTKTREEEL